MVEESMRPGCGIEGDRPSVRGIERPAGLYLPVTVKPGSDGLPKSKVEISVDDGQSAGWRVVATEMWGGWRQH
jgi:hypothetical protein